MAPLPRRARRVNSRLHHQKLSRKNVESRCLNDDNDPEMVSSFPAHLSLTGEYDDVVIACKQYADGLTLYIERAEQVLDGQAGSGAIVHILSGPNSPSHSLYAAHRALALGRKLLKSLNLSSFVLQTPSNSYWVAAQPTFNDEPQPGESFA